jgi:hypothetical protein
MTPREGFKYGFLLRCAEEGLTAEEAEARAARGLEKQADWSDAITTPISDVYSGIKGAIGGVPGALYANAPMVAGLGAAGVMGAGALGGYGLAKMQEGDIDPEEVQRQELIQAYQTQAELARRKAIMAAAIKAQPRSKSHYGI